MNNYHHGNLRISLIEAGIKLINKEGLNQLSLRKVAALCNVSHAAPYSHFKSKEELVCAMQEHVAGRFTQIFNDILSNNDKNNPSILGKIGEAYVLFFLDNPQYFDFLFFKGDPKINLKVSDSKKDSFPAFQIFKDTAVRIFKQFGMTEEKIQDEIISKWAFVHGFTSIATLKSVTYDKDWKDKIKEFLCVDN